MSVVTADEVVTLTDISVSAGTITSLGIIPLVQDRMCSICNNYFTSDELLLRDRMTFDGSALTIVADSSFEDEGFADGDDIYVYQSYRNDGFHTVSTVSDETLTLATGESVVAEKSGASILASVVIWPAELKLVAAQLVKFEVDDRTKRSADVRSRSLGPFSESYNDNEGAFGYPQTLIDQLSGYRVMRLM